MSRVIGAFGFALALAIVGAIAWWFVAPLSIDVSSFGLRNSALVGAAIGVLIGLFGLD